MNNSRYFSFSPFWLLLTFQYYGKNLIYDAEEKNGLFAATSATRVIIFAVRISFLIRSQWDVDRQPYSWKRQPRFDCALFSVPLALLCCRAASCFLFSLCLLLPFVLNCAAKVQRYLQTCKHFPEKVCIFNLLQQIKLICAVFIQILSTNLAKCAIYKANFFAFRLITYVPYIITNNNAIFV